MMTVVIMTRVWPKNHGERVCSRRFIAVKAHYEHMSTDFGHAHDYTVKEGQEQQHKKAPEVSATAGALAFIRSDGCYRLYSGVRLFTDGGFKLWILEDRVERLNDLLIARRPQAHRPDRTLADVVCNLGILGQSK